MAALSVVFLGPRRSSNRKGPHLSMRPLSVWTIGWSGSEAHAAHSAHATPIGSAGALALRLGLLGDHRFGRDQQAGNRGCILKRVAHDLGRVDDAPLHEVAVALLLGVEAEMRILALHHLAR